MTFLALLVTASAALGQGNFQYDHQSQGFPLPVDQTSTWDIQGNEPIGQSFTPALPSVGFVQLELFDGHPNNGLGATLYVNIRSGSITDQY